MREKTNILYEHFDRFKPTVDELRIECLDEGQDGFAHEQDVVLSYDVLTKDISHSLCILYHEIGHIVLGHTRLRPLWLYYYEPGMIPLYLWLMYPFIIFGAILASALSFFPMFPLMSLAGVCGAIYGRMTVINNELDANRFAVQHGYGLGLINDSFDTIARHVTESPLMFRLHHMRHLSLYPNPMDVIETCLREMRKI